MLNITTMRLSGINTCYKIWDDNVVTHSCMENLTKLSVSECVNLKSIFPSGMTTGLVKLQTLQIERCPNVEHIFVQEDTSNGLVVSLSNLEIVVIDDLKNLKWLWHDHLTPDSLCKLKEVTITRCPKLLNIFPSYVLNNLRNLEIIKVKKCDELENIFGIQDQPTSNSLCKLKRVVILGCPKLLNIFPSYVLNDQKLQHHPFVRDRSEIEGIVEKSDGDKIKSVYLEHLQISGCHRMKSVVSSSVVFQNLSTLSIFNCEGVVNILSSLTPASFPVLREMTIERCGSLDHIFSISLAKELQQLQQLYIRGCGIESIVEKSDTNEIKNVYLENLEIFGCHKMRCVIPSSSVIFQNLSKMSISNCEGVVNIMTPLTAASLPELRYLEITNCGSMEEIVANENDGDAPSVITFMKLEYLDLSDLPMLTSFCRGKYSFKFPSLKRKYVRQCPRMKTKPWEKKEEENIFSQGSTEEDTSEFRNRI